MMIIATALVQCMMRSGNGCSRSPCRVCDLTVARAIWKFSQLRCVEACKVSPASLRAMRRRYNQVVVKFPCWSRERRMMRHRWSIAVLAVALVAVAHGAQAQRDPPIILAEGGAPSDPQP